MIQAVVTVTLTLERFPNFTGGHPFTWREGGMESVRAWLMGPRQGAVDGWIQDSNIVGPKKSRERLLLKDPNLSDQVRKTIADAEQVRQRALKEKEIIRNGKE